jgi:hypothetical protein
MTKALKDAITEVERLPGADQDKIGREILAHVRKLGALRDDLSAGARSLDKGKGRELIIEKVIARARQRHAKD